MCYLVRQEPLSIVYAWLIYDGRNIWKDPFEAGLFYRGPITIEFSYDTEWYLLFCPDFTYIRAKVLKYFLHFIVVFKKIMRHRITYISFEIWWFNKNSNIIALKISKLWKECRRRHITPLIREFYRNGASSERNCTALFSITKYNCKTNYLFTYKRIFFYKRNLFSSQDFAYFFMKMVAFGCM